MNTQDTIIKFDTVARMKTFISMLEFLTPDSVTDMDFKDNCIAVTREGYNNFVREYPNSCNYIAVEHYEDRKNVFDTLPIVSELDNKTVIIKLTGIVTFKCFGKNYDSNREYPIYKLPDFIKLCKVFKFKVARMKIVKQEQEHEYAVT